MQLYVKARKQHTHSSSAHGVQSCNPPTKRQNASWQSYQLPGKNLYVRYTRPMQYILRAVIAIFWICYLVYNKLLTSAQEHKCPKCYEDDIPSAEFETNSISRWITVQSLKKVCLFKCLRWVHFFWKFFDIFKRFYGICLWAPDPTINSF